MSCSTTSLCRVGDGDGERRPGTASASRPVAYTAPVGVARCGRIVSHIRPDELWVGGIYASRRQWPTRGIALCTPRWWRAAWRRRLRCKAFSAPGGGVRSRKMAGGSAATGGYYYLEEVPWTCYFYSGYALHAAYWHDASVARAATASTSAPMTPGVSSSGREGRAEQPGGLRLLGVAAGSAPSCSRPTRTTSSDGKLAAKWRQIARGRSGASRLCGRFVLGPFSDFALTHPRYRRCAFPPRISSAARHASCAPRKPSAINSSSTRLSPQRPQRAASQ